MEGSFAEELYSETLKLSKIELGPASSSTAITGERDFHGFDGNDLQHEGGSIWDSSGEELDESSELDREWQRRRDQHHTVIRQLQMVFLVYLLILPLYKHLFLILVEFVSMAIGKVSPLGKKLLPKKDLILASGNQFWLGTTGVLSEVLLGDVLRLFNDDIVAKEGGKQSEDAEASSHVACLQEQSSDSSHLENYIGELQSLLSESPVLRVHFPVDK